MQLEQRFSALLQLYLHPRLNTWLQWFLCHLVLEVLRLYNVDNGPIIRYFEIAPPSNGFGFLISVVLNN